MEEGQGRAPGPPPISYHPSLVWSWLLGDLMMHPTLAFFRERVEGKGPIKNLLNKNCKIKAKGFTAPSFPDYNRVIKSHYI